MKFIYLDRAGECDFRVSWHTASGKKSRLFDSRDAAEGFAVSKMGKTGAIISTLDMTPEELAAHKARDARFRAALAGDLT